MTLGLLAALALAAAPARAYLPCSYIDADGAKPKVASTPCPQEMVYAEPDMPPSAPGMIWIQKKGTRDYWFAILLQQRAGGRLRSAAPPPKLDYPFGVIHCSDREQTHQINPDAEDYLRRALAEEWLGREKFAYAYAAQGLSLAPADKRLKAVVGRTAAAAQGWPAGMFMAQDAFNNGHRAMERGNADEALGWFDRSIAARPLAQAYFFRSQLRHAAGRDVEALKDAEDGLAMVPNDLMLKTARDQAANALAPAPISSAGAAPAQANAAFKSAWDIKDLGQPVIAEALPAAKRAVYAPDAPSAPAPAPPAAASVKKDDMRFVLFPILGLLMLGASGGYWLAGRHERKPALAPTIVDMRTVVGGATRNAPPTLRRYEVRSRIGAGGMGVVFEAVERNLGRRVAIKQMRAEIKDEERERAAFLKEAEIISGLKHPNIVAFQEVIQEDGEIYLVFEYVDGKPLSKLLADEGRLPLSVCRKLFSQVCSAISCAHKAHVLHRDLKPSNIMVDADGNVKVMDFGIARQAKDTITRLTRADASGTPAYMAPEQHLGSCAKPSDIYALGVCLYEALTGRLPFPGPDFLAQKERMKYAPPKILATDLPKEVDLLFQATLALNPEHRVADAEELIGSLDALAA